MSHSLHLGIGNVVWVDAGDAEAVVVDVQHDLDRFVLATMKDRLEDPDHELPGGVVVVVEEDLVELGAFDLLLGLRACDDKGLVVLFRARHGMT